MLILYAQMCQVVWDVGVWHIPASSYSRLEPIEYAGVPPAV
jgi:hypothetical protein